ncbi:heat shock protein [Niveomyces insectorum RCEF 264]|uniref:Heat shock protein n=1 Tax=Niveomyces insectorum RCEF 264 TaxID=1081102 RepID=A0A162KC63_9HYPO|nr:heat shock protein [Niveomyces insectorum RCEF 264]
MRPPEAFGRPRPVAAADGDAAATPLAGVACAGGSSTGVVGGASGMTTTTTPMMTYFFAEEADVDAVVDSGNNVRDPEPPKRSQQQQQPPQPRHGHGLGKLEAGGVAGSLSSVPANTSQREPVGRYDESETGTAHPNLVDSTADHGPTSQPRPSTPPHPVHPGSAHNHGHGGHGQIPTTTHHHHHHRQPSASFSPLFSQSTTPSLMGTSGPASLSAMSSPSSRRNSLSSSLMDENLGSADALSRDPSFELDRRVLPTGCVGGGIDGGCFVHDGSTALPNTAASVETTSAADAAGVGENHESRAAASASYLFASGTLSTANGSMMLDSGSAPQLIMPSIKMPSRRPFTDTGKNMGRFKALIAGDSGVGKTSLIKAIVQSCQHIVHVDHITPQPFSLAGSRRTSAATAPLVDILAGGDIGPTEGTLRPKRKSSRSSRSSLSTSQITEIYASTKPYPSWWSELSDARGWRRRKSLGDAVLDRNICFVDTPGYSGNASTMDAIMPVVQYVEATLRRLCTNSLSDADFVSLVSGDGGGCVDVVFYMVSGDLKPADIEYMRLLSSLTNVIPLLARADALCSEADMAAAKERMARQLHEANIDTFAFTTPTTGSGAAVPLASASGPHQPYAVSSANGSDHDVMDASLLMSPDYVQPLVATDLATLVEHVFCLDGVARLRHAAARKVAKWRKAATAYPNDHDNNGSSNSNSNNGSSNSNSNSGSSIHQGWLSPASPSRPAVLTTPLGAPASFALARMTDHTQREEHLAQMRLATWAAELQRNLDSERARYAKLARSERAVWLTERLSECVQDGTLVAVPATASGTATAAAAAAARTTTVSTPSRSSSSSLFRSTKRRSARSSPAASLSSSTMTLSTAFSHEDPLGLLEVTAGLRARGLLLLEVLGSLSVLGGVALWMAKHNYHLQVYGWCVAEWSKLWNGER